MTASQPTGMRMRLRLMPRAVRAMISLSMDMRPRPRRTPMRTDMGIVKTRRLGMMQRKRVSDLRGGTGMADEDLHEMDEFGDEEDEGENEEAEEGVASNFAGDVAVEDAHGEKGECNMGVGFDVGGGGRWISDISNQISGGGD